MRGTKDLAAGERRIFAAVAGAVVGEGVGVEVADAAVPFVRRLSESDRRLLSLALRTVEYGAPFLARRPRRFTGLSQEAREACLRRLADSRIPLLRQTAASLKSLAAIVYYGREESWGDVGYDGPWLGRRNVAVLPAPDLRGRRSGTARRDVLPAGVTAGDALPGGTTLRAQVCVIGTGAGGGAAIARLAARGLDVIGVEAGSYTTARDYTQREDEMLPLLFQEAGLRATADKAIGILQGTGVGGSTLHNTGLVYPTPAAIAERWRREHGLPLDQPLLEEYVSHVIAMLRAVAIPSESINANNDALKRGADALGWRYRIPLHNRVECSECGYCMLGCAYNRKSNAALTFLPEAVRAGARLLTRAAASRIEGRPGARRVVCDVLASDEGSTARRVTIEAPVVVLAAGALDSPAILRRSGLGNGQVGQRLRLHPAAIVSATFPDPILAWRGLPQSVLVEEFASFLDDGRGGFLLIASASNWPALTAALISDLGVRHRARMLQHQYSAAVAVLLHDETAGRVTAARDGRPIPHYWPERADLDGLAQGIAAAARIYLAAGAERVHLPYAGTDPVRSEAELRSALHSARPDRHRLSLTSVHPQGTCALGADPQRSAVDPHGEVWGESGVFVADASLFPTSVGVPPQVTIMALATAVADRIAERFSRTTAE